MNKNTIALFVTLSDYAVLNLCMILYLRTIDTLCSDSVQRQTFWLCMEVWTCAYLKELLGKWLVRSFQGLESNGCVSIYFQSHIKHDKYSAFFSFERELLSFHKATASVLAVTSMASFWNSFISRCFPEIAQVSFTAIIWIVWSDTHQTVETLFKASCHIHM